MKLTTVNFKPGFEDGLFQHFNPSCVKSGALEKYKITADSIYTFYMNRYNVVTQKYSREAGYQENTWDATHNNSFKKIVKGVKK